MSAMAASISGDRAASDATDAAASDRPMTADASSAPIVSPSPAQPIISPSPKRPALNVRSASRGSATFIAAIANIATFQAIRTVRIGRECTASEKPSFTSCQWPRLAAAAACNRLRGIPIRRAAESRKVAALNQ